MFWSDVRFEIRRIGKAPVDSLLGITSLSVGIAIFVLGLMYINNEKSYDKGFSDHERIFRIESHFGDGHTALFRPTVLSDMLVQRSAGIASSTKFLENSIDQPLITADNGKAVYLSHCFQVDTAFFSVFNFPFVFGDSRRVLEQTKSIVLSKSVAKSLFGDVNPVGKIVKVGEFGGYMISGVFDNTGFPTHLTLDAAIPLKPLAGGQDPWVSQFTVSYVKLNGRVAPATVAAQMNRIFGQAVQTFGKKVGGTGVDLVPIADIYLHTHNGVVAGDIFKKGNGTGIWLIGCLTFFVLVVSVVNFANLNLTAAGSRAKEIAIRRFIGSRKWRIFAQLYTGIGLQCVAAIFLAMLLVGTTLPGFEQILQLNLPFFSRLNSKIWLDLFALLALVVLLTGTYPIVYLTMMRFATVLKGGALNSRRGNRVRNILLVIQFTVTCIFISGVLIISRQLRYLSEQDLGFRPDQVLVIKYGALQTQFQYPLVKQTISRIAGVENVSFASEAGLLSEKFVMHLMVEGQLYQPQYICADTGYMSIMGARFLAGRNFSVEDTGATIIINQALAQLANVRDVNGSEEIFMNNKPARVVGIISDMNFTGFEQRVGPMAFTSKQITLTPYLLIKVSANSVQSTVAHIEDAWRSIEPGYPIRISFLDESFNQLYQQYGRLTKIFALFLACSLALAFIGLFSVASLTIQQRSKEIAIRKVLGASSTGVVQLLTQRFVLIVVIANGLAIPITIYLQNLWLSNFAFRVAFSALPFAVAMLGSMVLTIATVGLKSMRTAMAAPTRALKQE